MSEYEQRPDVLIAEARRAINHATGQVGISAPELIRLTVRLTDMLEAATGGDHITAKHWAQLAKARTQLKAEARRNDALAHALAQAVTRADDWLDQERADAAAQALEEAADEIEIRLTVATTPQGVVSVLKEGTTETARAWLRDRAASYRKEQTDAD